jgi:hypothetical protein
LIDVCLIDQCLPRWYFQDTDLARSDSNVETVHAKTDCAISGLRQNASRLGLSSHRAKIRQTYQKAR